MHVKKIVSSLVLATVLTSSMPTTTHAEIDWQSVGVGSAIGLTLGSIGTYIITKRLIANGLAQLAQAQAQSQESPFTEEHEKTFDDFVGYDRAVKQAKQFIAQQLIARQLVTQPAADGAKRFRGLLLEGPQGSGKTLLAHVIANKLECSLLSISGNVFVGKTPQECDGIFRHLFGVTRARSKEKCTVLFIDDLDVLFAQKNPFAKKMFYMLVDYLNELTDDENFLVIGAVRNGDLINHTLLQRGKIERIKLFFPNREGRIAILKKYLKDVPLDSDLDLETVAKKWADQAHACTRVVTPEFLKFFVAKTSQTASYEKSETVKDAHFEKAFFEIGGGQCWDEPRTRQEVRKIAIHEAGHAVAALLTGNKVLRVSVLPQERYFGAVYSQGEHESSLDYGPQDWAHDIMVLFGSYCAEKMLCGQITPSMIHDLSVANGIASNMVSMYGMGDGLAGITSKHLRSEAMKEKFDHAMVTILDACLQAAEKLLALHREKIEILADALMQKERLTQAEVYALVGEPINCADELLPPALLPFGR